MSVEPPPFRTGNSLATTFTGTLTERCGEAVERVPTPQRLLDWLEVNGLAVDTCTVAELELARDLRESIHAVLTAIATGATPPASAVEVLNARSTEGRAAPLLTPGGSRRWDLGSSGRVRDALSVIAADAINIAAGEREGRLAMCSSPTCQAVFLDTSQSRTRKWCDMNTCGNRQKKARFKAHQRPSR